jgi:hypothetical protein
VADGTGVSVGTVGDTSGVERGGGVVFVGVGVFMLLSDPKTCDGRLHAPIASEIITMENPVRVKTVGECLGRFEFLLKFGAPFERLG